MLEEKPQHLSRGVRPARIGVGAGGAASRPCVSGAMDLPVLKDRPPARVGTDRSGIGMAARYPTTKHLLSQTRRSHGLGDDMIAVAGMHGGVAIAMKNDRWDNRPAARN